MPIDRRSVVGRHDVVLTAPDARTPLTVKRLGQQQRGCDDDNRAVPQVPSVSALAANDKCLASVHRHSDRPAHHNAQHETTTDNRRDVRSYSGAAGTGHDQG